MVGHEKESDSRRVRECTEELRLESRQYVEGRNTFK